MNRLWFSLIFIFVLLTGVVNAEYPYIGYDDFNNDNGIYNRDADNTLTGTRLLTDSAYTPVTGDIDNDNITEIIVYDSGYLKIYEDYTLTPDYTIALHDTSADYGAPYLYDLDSDGNLSILIGEIANFASETMYVFSYGWNGTTVTYEKNWSVTDGALAVYGGSWFPLIGCMDDVCLIVLNNDDGIHGVQATADGLNAFSITDTHTSDPIYINNIYGIGGGTTAYGLLCLPDIPVIANDDDYFYFTYHEYKQSAVPLLNTNSLRLAVIEINSTDDPNLIDHPTLTSVYSGFNAYSGSCSDVSVPVTSPLVSDDIYRSLSGSEIVIGYRYDADEFQMVVLDETLTTIDTVGSLPCYKGNGHYLSNPILTDVYEDTGTEDYCIAGYGDSTPMTFLCSSMETGYSHFLCKDVYIDLTALYNMTFFTGDIAPIYNNIIHSTEQIANGNSEFLTAFGVLSFDWDDCNGNECSFYYERVFTDLNASKVFSDIKDTGLSDLLILGDEYIQYWDDGYSNTAGYISDITVNPCIDTSVAKFNSSLTVTVTCDDADSDTVSSRVFIYYDTAYEQLSNWTAYHTAGLSEQHDLILNKTFISATLRVECRDSINPTDIDYQEEYFSVATDGVEFGDCMGSYDVTTPDEEEAEAEAEASGIGTADSNSIKSSADEIASYTHLPTAVIFLIVLGMIIYGLWSSPLTENNPQLTFGTIIIVCILFFFGGVYVGVIPFGVVFAMVVVGLIPIAVWIGKKLLGHGSE